MSASAAALTTISAGSASAQVAVWTGTTSNDWTVGSNWSTGTAPVANTININSATNSPVLGVNGPAIGTAGATSVGTLSGQTGALTIQNGSTLTSTSSSRLAIVAGSGGTVTVTGPGSQWLIPSFAFYVGFAGNGTLNIQDGGRVFAPLGTTVGRDVTSSGTLNISGGGTLETGFLRNTNGAAQVNFDNGILQATANNATFINGFAGTELNILAGGLTVDTGAFTVGTDATSPFTGVGGLTKIGAGTLNLATDNTYTGQTVIQAGTLALTGIGSVASSSRVIANGTFDISALAGAGTSIQRLAGSGAVTLGAKNLTITNANDLFSGIISGTGGLTVSGGTQTLSGANTFTGGTTITAGTLAVNGSVCGGMNVLAGGRLQGTGTVCETTSFGTIAPGNSIGTLTVNGNYTGNGGLLEIETVLGGDASPTDRLVVTGDTAGTTNVRVINVGGAGAQTVEGIRIVDVGGASNGAFSLQGDYVVAGQQAVIAGAYAYTLQQNGISTPADGDWYLRSSLVNPPPAAPAGPLFQPGVPLYESYGQVLLGLNELSSLQQRVGNRFRGGSDVIARMGIGGSAPYVAGVVSPVWGRVEGRRASLNPSNRSGSNLDTDQFKFEAGLDALAVETKSGKLIFGLLGHYNEANAEISSFFGSGKIRTSGGGVGGTATWYGDEGLYVDGQARASWYSSSLTSALIGPIASGNDGFGYAFGVESGKRVAVGNGWSLTPQAQLSYSSIMFDSFVDRFAAAVSLVDAESLLGRAGVSLDHQRSWQDASGQLVRSDVYGIANLHYEFLDGSQVDVAGTRFANATDRLWGGVGAGGTFSWANERYALYGEVSYNTSLEDVGDSYSYKGTAGFRVRW